MTPRMNEEKHKVCMNKECLVYNIVSRTNETLCPWCNGKLTYPVVTEMPKEI